MTDDQHDQLPTAVAPAPAPGLADAADDFTPSGGEATADGTESIGEPSVRSAAKRRRGSRGGRNRKKPAGAAANGSAGNGDVGGADDYDDDGEDELGDPDGVVDAEREDGDEPELPKRLVEGRPSAAAAERALVRKPQIGDTRPAPAVVPAPAPAKPAQQRNERNRGERAKGDKPKQERQPAVAAGDGDGSAVSDAAKKKRKRGVKGPKPVSSEPAVDLDADTIERRRGRERNGRPIGRYLMAVQVRPSLTQVAVLEGRTLIEHYVSRPADDVSQIHGNIYLGKVQNVLPGMEAAFVDIGTPKNAVLYRGDVQYDPEDIVEKSGQPRIEQMLRPKQLVLCQVTKNPISAKGARLTQEVSLPGRFVVLIPNSKTYGISKRLPDDVRKRLRNILDRVKPAQHGLIVRTAAENANEHELRADMTRLLDQWNVIEAKAKRANSPTLLYREPELAVRVIREEFNAEYRGVVIDDQRLFEDVRDYVAAFNPDLADRIEFYDATVEGLPLYERQHIHEQLHKALDRKVWLPSGGSLIIEHTEALTVIDVNTGKNVGTSNLEETVFRNNLEAADEVAKQLRLRDIGGIVVIDFIDMEIKDNRRKVVDGFRSALARDKTRTQVFDISDLGLVEMTRKRIGEGLLVNFADQCPNCDGRGVIIDHALLE
ncbi:MAG TPA: Rne/Rng family ribonuclease [Ilumatobacteraceae bacterium]|nr:Rne/Rng family ribonuclease [Ilumatobacteraceae bacterium]